MGKVPRFLRCAKVKRRYWAGPDELPMSAH